MTCKKTAIIVTGGSGYIGSALTSYLRNIHRNDVTIVSLSSDCCDLRTSDAFLFFKTLSKQYRVSQVFHLAAIAPSGIWLANHPADAWFSNTLMNATVFESVRRHLPKAKIITTLSYSMYADTAEITENNLENLKPTDDRLTAYANTKTTVLAAQDAYLRQYGLQSCSVVLPTVYGPDLSIKKSKEQSITAICRKFLMAVAGRANSVTLLGSGNQHRELLYIDDTVTGIVKAAEQTRSSIINLDSGVTVSILEVATIIAQLTGFKGKLIFEEDQYTGAQNLNMKTNSSAVSLDWKPKFDLINGLKKTIASIKT